MANNIIDSIQLSGTVYTLSAQTSGGGNPTIELTQAQYDALVTAGTVQADTYYIITDAQGGDLSNYYTKTETNTLLGGKADTATYNAYTASTDTALAGKQTTLTAGTGIDITDNVISATGGGGGKAVSGGTNISITTGETADTINCTIPMSAGSTFFSAVIGRNNNKATATSALAGGEGCEANSNNSFTFGLSNTAKTGSNGSVVFGFRNYSDVQTAFVCGKWNNMANANTSDTFGSSGNTLVAVGNGWASNDWLSPQPIKHNAFEIRQNGDIYIADTNDTSTTNWYQKPMVRLQDTITALGGLKLVKLSQSEYDSLTTKDNSTLYVIVN